jgi:hypothetical protein
MVDSQICEGEKGEMLTPLKRGPKVKHVIVTSKI